MSQLDVSTGTPCWIDLYASDPDRSRAFYSELFNWTAEDTGEEFGGYVNFAKDGRYVGGCMHNGGQSGAPDSWSVYLRTDDARRVVEDTLVRWSSRRWR